MELNEQMRIGASRRQVFAALNDPVILREAIPGCESFEARSPTEFVATVTSKIGPLVARFTGSVRLSDVVVDEQFTLTGDGKAGPVGFAKVVAQVSLAEDGPVTVMSYKVKADIGGKLGQLGGGLIERTSKKLSGEFFAKLEDLIAPEDGLPQDLPVAPETAVAAMPARRSHARIYAIVFALLGGLAVAGGLIFLK